MFSGLVFLEGGAGLLELNFPVFMGDFSWDFHMQKKEMTMEIRIFI